MIFLKTKIHYTFNSGARGEYTRNTCDGKQHETSNIERRAAAVTDRQSCAVRSCRSPDISDLARRHEAVRARRLRAPVPLRPRPQTYHSWDTHIRLSLTTSRPPDRLPCNGGAGVRRRPHRRRWTVPRRSPTFTTHFARMLSHATPLLRRSESTLRSLTPSPR